MSGVIWDLMEWHETVDFQPPQQSRETNQPQSKLITFYFSLKG
jgi:hypothetical protein